jgi:hypothetical protein
MSGCDVGRACLDLNRLADETGRTGHRCDASRTIERQFGREYSNNVQPARTGCTARRQFGSASSDSVQPVRGQRNSAATERGRGLASGRSSRPAAAYCCVSALGAAMDYSRADPAAAHGGADGGRGAMRCSRTSIMRPRTPVALATRTHRGRSHTLAISDEDISPAAVTAGNQHRGPPSNRGVRWGPGRPPHSTKRPDRTAPGTERDTAGNTSPGEQPGSRPPPPSLQDQLMLGGIEIFAACSQCCFDGPETALRASRRRPAHAEVR